MVVADPAEHGGFEPQASRTECDVRRRATEVFGKTADILQPRTDLLCVKIDAEAPEANQIQLTPTGKTSLAHAGSCYFYQPALRAEVARNALGGCRLERLSMPINIYSINFLCRIFFPIFFGVMALRAKQARI